MASQFTHHLAAKTVDDALAGERYQLHVAGLSRLEPHRGAGRDIEPHAARLLAVEFKGRIGLEEVVMRADLDRSVAGVGDRERHRLAAGIEFDLAVLDEEFTWDHLSSSVIPGRCAASNPESRQYNLWILRCAIAHHSSAALRPPRNDDGYLIGSCTVTSFVPSGNVASTWMSWIISGMPSMHCAR